MDSNNIFLVKKSCQGRWAQTIFLGEKILSSFFFPKYIFEGTSKVTEIQFSDNHIMLRTSFLIRHIFCFLWQNIVCGKICTRGDEYTDSAYVTARERPNTSSISKISMVIGYSFHWDSQRDVGKHGLLNFSFNPLISQVNFILSLTWHSYKHVSPIPPLNVRIS